MKITDIRASLKRLAERLDNQWAYARSDAEMDIAAGRAEYNDDGERLPTEPEIRYYGMIAAFVDLFREPFFQSFSGRDRGNDLCAAVLVRNL